MPKEEKKDTTENKQNSGVSKPQLLRVSTIIKNHNIDSVTANAAMTANQLKPTSRIEPPKFLKMLENFKQRKINRSGGRR